MLEVVRENFEDGLGAGEQWEPLFDPALSSFREIEQGEGQITMVHGSLKRKLVRPCNMDYRLYQKGYKLPLCIIPDRFYKCNQVFALEHKDFVSQALQELKENHCIIRGCLHL